MGEIETHPRYLAERLRQRLAEDARRMGVEVEVSDDEVVLRGSVSDEDGRTGAGAMAAEAFPRLRVRNELTVPERDEPGGVERLG
jgi:osmotically-inducible protein OsmY